MRCEILENPYRGLEALGGVVVSPEADAIHFTNGSQLLTVVRSSHNYYPYSQEHNVLRAACSVFVANTEPGSRIMLFEGKAPPCTDDIVADSRDFGLRGLTAHLGKHYDIPLEPWGEEKYFKKLFDDGFDPDTLLYYATLRHAPGWDRSRLEQHTPLIFYLENIWLSYRSEFQEQGPAGLVFASLRDTHERLFNRQLEDDIYQPYFALDQTAQLWQTETEVQQAAVAWNVLRDEQLFSMMQNKWKVGKSIFVMGGWQHGYALEPRFVTFGEQIVLPPRAIIYPPTSLLWSR